MTRYKLAFAITKYFDYGGLQRDLIRIAQECLNRGHTVELVTGKWDSLLAKPFTVHEQKYRARSNHGRNDELAACLQDITAAGDFDCVIGFTKISGLDVYYAGDPCYAEKFSKTKLEILKMLPRYKALLRQESDVFRHGNHAEILLIAHQEQESFITHYRTELKRFHLLPPGINRVYLGDNIPSKNERELIRHKFGITDGDLLIFSLGSGFRTKGVDRSIRALAALPAELGSKVYLIVAGKGKSQSFASLARKLGVNDRVKFIGVCDRVAELYYSADALLHPAFSENTGTTIIEAMYCGLPVLATENCGFSIHLRNADAGLVCPVPFRQQVLNQQLEEILTSPKRSDWMKNGVDYCQRTDLYSSIEMAADIIIKRAERNHSSKNDSH